MRLLTRDKNTAAEVFYNDWSHACITMSVVFELKDCSRLRCAVSLRQLSFFVTWS